MHPVGTHLLRLSTALAIAAVAAAPAVAEPAKLKLGGVEGESTNDKHKGEIEIESFSWGTERATGDSSDPEEGGEIAAKPKVSDRPVIKVSDKSTATLAPSAPEEGGEIALPREPLSAIPKQKVKSPRDVATGRASGKRQHQPVAMVRGSVTVVMPEGLCSAGTRYPFVTLLSADHRYEMQDVTVASCTPAVTAKGKKDKAKLDYMIVTMETILVTG